MTVTRIRTRSVIRCAVCGAGWYVTRQTTPAMIAEAVARHQAQHRQISAQDRSNRIRIWVDPRDGKLRSEGPAT